MKGRSSTLASAASMSYVVKGDMVQSKAWRFSSHRRTRLDGAATCLLLCLLAGGLDGPPLRAAAEDWPQFRGPTGQGHSTEAGLPIEWSETRNVLWKVPVSRGWSSPVVSGGRVYLTAVDSTRNKQ